MYTPYQHHIMNRTGPPSTETEFRARCVWAIIHAHKVRGRDSHIAAERLFNQVWPLAKRGASVNGIALSRTVVTPIHSAVMDSKYLFKHYMAAGSSRERCELLLSIPGIGPKAVMHLARLCCFDIGGP